jgi:hypothetical protein
MTSTAARETALGAQILATMPEAFKVFESVSETVVTPVVAGNGKTHGAVGEAQAGKTTKTLCNRTIVPDTTYYAKDWQRMVDTHNRLGKTHVVYTCAKCVKVYNG